MGSIYFVLLQEIKKNNPEKILKQRAILPPFRKLTVALTCFINYTWIKKENKALLNALDQDKSAPTVGLYMSPSIKESFDNLIKNQNVPEEILLQLEGILQKFKGTPLLNK